MIKAKKIGLILDKDILLEAELKNGIVISVNCEFIDADYDRLYLRFPDDKVQMEQYFYEDRTVSVGIDTLDGRRVYPAKVLYAPAEGLIVIEYFEDENILQKRKILRVRATKAIDVRVQDKNIAMLTIDISGGGCKILSPVELAKGSFADGYLKLISGAKPIKVKMKIHRINFLSAENKYELSCEFCEIKEADRKIIMQYCYNVQSEKLLGRKRLD